MRPYRSSSRTTGFRGVVVSASDWHTTSKQDSVFFSSNLTTAGLQILFFQANCNAKPLSISHEYDLNLSLSLEWKTVP